MATAIQAPNPINTIMRPGEEALIVTGNGFDGSYASFNLQHEWNKSCALAMGITNHDNGSSLSPRRNKTIPVISLLSPSQLDSIDGSSSPTASLSPYHSWLQGAIAIGTSLDQMSRLVTTKAQDYARISFLHDNSMSEQDRSVLESTVLSYSATTANQIETLRQQVSTYQGDLEAHMAGIVACLMQTLQLNVVNPMARLQKERNAKMAVAILKEPYRCEVVSCKQHQDELDDLLEGPIQTKFIPQSSHFVPSSTIVNVHHKKESPSLKRPTSQLLEVFKQHKKKKAMVESNPTTKPIDAAARMATMTNDSKRSNSWFNTSHLQEEQFDESIQRESAQLLAQVHSDLEGVQKVEQTMTEVTSLLTQFSNLISQQQEEILAIHDDVAKSKENVKKGQDALLDAQQRTRQSKHYMAIVICFFTMILLFFNFVNP